MMVCLNARKNGLRVNAGVKTGGQGPTAGLVLNGFDLYLPIIITHLSEAEKPC